MRCDLRILVDEPPTETERGRGLDRTQLSDQLVSLEAHPLLQVDHSGVDLLARLEQSDRDLARALEDLPREWGPTLSLRHGALVDDQVVSMETQEVRLDDPAAAEQEQ